MSPAGMFLISGLRSDDSSDYIKNTQIKKKVCFKQDYSENIMADKDMGWLQDFTIFE